MGSRVPHNTAPLVILGVGGSQVEATWTETNPIHFHGWTAQSIKLLMSINGMHDDLAGILVGQNLCDC